MTDQSSVKLWLGLAGWLAVTGAAALAGSVASVSAESFYAQMTQPSWAPPSSVFGPVWSVLYFLMGVAAWLVWRQQGFAAARLPLVIYLVHLVVNALWSWVFFAWRLGGPAFLTILLLWLMIVILIVLFWRISRPAGWLLLPYLSWVSFAAFLNLSVWQMNPDVLG